MKEYLVYSCLIVLVYCLTGINSQLGPVPPRLSIVGSIGTPVQQPLQYRNERLVSGAVPNGEFLRSRRPILATPPRPETLQPFHAINSLGGDEGKPVTEENESAETPSFHVQQQQPQPQFIPQTLQSQPQFHQQQFKAPLPPDLYTTDENGEILEHHRPLEFGTTPRLLQQPNPEIIPTTIRTTGGAQRFVLNQDRPVQSRDEWAARFCGLPTAHAQCPWAAGRAF